jgi:hypothetical protein
MYSIPFNTRQMENNSLNALNLATGVKYDSMVFFKIETIL